MQRVILLIVTLFITGVKLAAQGQGLEDSLLQVLKTAKEDSNKAKFYFKLGQLQEETQPDLAKQYFKLAGQVSEKVNFKRGVFGYYTFYGDILNRQGYFDSALQLSLKLVDYSKKINDSTYLAYAFIAAGQRYRQLHIYDKAIEYLENGRIIRHRIGDTNDEADISGAIGFIYGGMHQYRKAVEYILSGAAILEKENDSLRLADFYTSLGYYYINLQRYDSAAYFLKKSSAIAQLLSNDILEMQSQLNLAYLYYKQGKVEVIEPIVKKALFVAKKYGMPEWEGHALWGLALYNLYEKNIGKAKLYADSSMQIAARYNMREIKMRAYNTLSQIAFSEQDTRLGHYYSNQSEILRDSILNETILTNTTFYEAQFQTQKKEIQIRLQQTELKQQSILNYILVAGALGLLSILLLSYKNYRNRQKIQQARIDELETEKRLTATEAVLKGEEQERTRLARDLHDGLGGMLSGIKFSLRNMKENLIMTPDNAQAFERSIDMLDSSIREMRRVAHNMMPEMLVKYGLNTALKEFCDEITRSGVTNVNYQSIAMRDAAVGQTESVTVYRIVQELVNNAIKHANAQNVLVQLHLHEQEKLLAVTVEDDGKGFDAGAITDAAGIGWKNIRSRVAFLQGKIDVQSAPGSGTSILIEINI